MNPQQDPTPQYPAPEENVPVGQLPEPQFTTQPLPPTERFVPPPPIVEPFPLVSPQPPRKKNKIGIVLSVLAVLLLGAGSWFAYGKLTVKPSETTVATQSTGTKTEQPPTSTPPTKTEATTDWASYTNTAGKYSFKYPKTWVTASNPEFCNEGLTLLGTSPQTVGRCASDGFGQISLYSSGGDTSANYGEGYTKKTVKIDGASATRYSGTIEDAGDGPGAPNGTEVITYVAYANDRTFVATYHKYQDAEDLTSEFDTLITKTVDLLD